MNDYQKLIAASRYARWRESDGRREFWDETVARLTWYWADKGLITSEEARELYDAIYNLRVMPSMRSLMTAGEALDRDNMAGYNCSYIHVDHPRAFDEIMYVLMCGTGVGFSVERQFTNKLPEVAETLHDTDTTIVVEDSKLGWAKALKQLISMLYAGEVPKYDISKVRPAGARLKTFGGRASGPEPLVSLFDFAINLFKGAAGRKLNDLECHDLVCKIAEIVVVGGVRRSALISLSNPSSDRMRTAKSGAWWNGSGQRALANNSACYTERPDFEFFMREMSALYESKSGERGVFSRVAAKKIAGRNGRRDADHEFGTNPCSEILLRSGGVCNLSEVIVRADDDLDSLKEKVRLATILGTLQATLTDFRYVRAMWKRNAEEEALLGVSFTGIMDNTMMAGVSDPEALSEWLTELKQVAIDTNLEWSERLGISQAAAITCVKPSGTVSQLCDTASGIHPRFAPHYIRTVRQDNKDPVTQFLKDQGVDAEPCVMKPDSTTIFSFRMAAPKNAVCVSDVGALEQLKLWKIYQDAWCEHKPSITVYYTDDEFFDICAWMWKNFDSMSGVSLLPYDGGTYQQAPYQQIDKAQYEEEVQREPSINWEALSQYETDDQTTGSQELACVGTSCELP